VIVLLNVIIAVIADAFERARIGSDQLFGKARIQFVAQNEALKSFFRPDSRIASSIDHVDGIGKQLLAVVGRLLRWAAFITLITTAIVSNMYLFGRARAVAESILDHNALHGSWASEAMSFSLFAVLSAALLTMLRVALRGCLRNCSDSAADRLLGDRRSCVVAVNNKIASVMFGLGTSKAQAGVKEEDEWNGRMVYLERAFESIVGEAKKDLKSEMTNMEIRIKKEFHDQDLR